MIIVRSPLRIPLGGGGTDLPSYYERFGGYLLSAAIDKYVYVAINATFDSLVRLKYSEYELETTTSQVKHPIIREVLRKYEVRNSIEISSMADIPAGTGLGSSGAFTCAMIKGVATFLKHEDAYLSPAGLAEAACDIEINRLGESVGKQDPYISAYGGIREMEFEKGKASIRPLSIDDLTLYSLGKSMKLYFTGYYRQASTALATQDKKTKELDSEMLGNLSRVKQIGMDSAKAIKKGDLGEFAELMREHWDLKQKRGTTTPEINRIYERAMKSGAIAGKLVGAGLGGFLLFVTEEPARLTGEMAKFGLKEQPFWFDFTGTTTVEIS